MIHVKSVEKADQDDLLFFGRNHAYGAYELRKHYDNRLGKAFLSTMAFFCLIVLIFNNLPHKKGITLITKKDGKQDTVIYRPSVVPVIEEPAGAMRAHGFTPYVHLTTDRDTGINNHHLDMASIGDIDTKAFLPNNGGNDNETNGLMGLGGGRMVDPIVPKKPAFDSFPDNDAQFPGGQNAYLDYLHRNIKYPIFAVEEGVHGTISLSMKIDEYGRIADVTVIKGIGHGCDEEAVKAIKAMPRWVPGRKNGENIAVVHFLRVQMVID